jgi:hypothetical protein
VATDREGPAPLRPLAIGLIPFAMLAANLKARAYWGGNPSCGPVSMRIGSFDRRILGQADLSDCAVVINDRFVRWPWPALCTITIHEAGHLHGLTHASPYWVMHARYRGPVAACESRSPWLQLPLSGGTVLTDWPT